MPATTLLETTDMILPKRSRPRSRACCPVTRYSGTMRSITTGSPSVETLPSTSTQVQTKDVDAVFVCAHPTRENDLAEVEQARAGNAHQKYDDGVALCPCAIARAGQDFPHARE